MCRPLSQGDTERCRNRPDADLQHWQRRLGSAVCSEGETSPGSGCFNGGCDELNGRPRRFVRRCPSCLTDADREKSSALTCGSEAAGTTTGRPVASTRSRPSPPCASCRTRTTCWLPTCWARSVSVHANDAAVGDFVVDRSKHGRIRRNQPVKQVTVVDSSSSCRLSCGTFA